MTPPRRRAVGLRSLAVERELLAAGVRTVIGMDEVGRGALAGPVGVGAVRFELAALLDGDDAAAEAGSPTAAEAGPMSAAEARIPAGLRDSKQVPLAQRAPLAEAVAAWQPEHAVAYASPGEIDACGMTMALCLAGRRALAALQPADLVLLDGSFDWLSAALTFDALTVFGEAADVAVPEVRTVVKGDGTVVAIAAASILAKVDRDAIMVALDAEFPAYGWASNAGYGAPAHRAAIAADGPSPHHRRSFRLS